MHQKQGIFRASFFIVVSEKEQGRIRHFSPLWHIWISLSKIIQSSLIYISFMINISLKFNQKKRLQLRKQETVRVMIKYKLN